MKWSVRIYKDHLINTRIFVTATSEGRKGSILKRTKQYTELKLAQNEAAVDIYIIQ